MNNSKRYENTLVAILFFTWGTVFLDRMSGLYLAPFIAREFQLTNEQIGMLASALAITWAISTPKRGPGGLCLPNEGVPRGPTGRTPFCAPHT